MSSNIPISYIFILSGKLLRDNPTPESTARVTENSHKRHVIPADVIIRIVEATERTIETARNLGSIFLEPCTNSQAETTR